MVTGYKVTGPQLVEEIARCFAIAECHLEHPGQPNHRERTRYELEAGSVEVRVTYADGSEARALLADFSTDGARFVTDRLPSCNEVVGLSFDLGDRRVTLNGQVVHRGCGDALSYFGISFTDLPVDPDAQVAAMRLSNGSG